jgi:hypothetical protein
MAKGIDKIYKPTLRDLMKHSIFKSFVLPAFVFAAMMATQTSSFAADAVKTEAAKEEIKKEEAKKEEAVDKEIEKYNKASEKAFETLKEISANLKEADAKHFYMIYNNYNLIGTVKVVQGDVKNAVKACGENNPDMKADMDARYKTWNGALQPVIKESEANVNNMILAQDYAESAKIKKAFKALDDARRINNEQMDKQPVTTAEACEYLGNKMSDTQENLVTLLRTTLVSFGKANPEAAAPKDAKKDSKEESKEKPVKEKPAEEKAPAADDKKT